MIETVVRSEGLPPADRFAWWQEMACRAHVPTVARSEHEADFRATMHLLDLGAVQLASLQYPSLQPQRTQKLIRQSDPEIHYLSLTLRGTMRLAQSGREALASPRDLILYDSSHPFQGRAVANDDAGVAGMVLHIPKPLLPLPADTLARLTAVRLSGNEGVGALLFSHLCALARHATEYTAADADRLTAVTLDLFAAVYARHLEADALLSPETHRRALQLRIHAFIQRNLDDPHLCAEAVAAAHQISTRYLYQLFQDQELAVAAWIRHLRLERCRRDLANPDPCSRPIHVIASRWGFTNNAHFSRLFRAAYAVSPADYRRQAQRGTVQDSTISMQKQKRLLM